MLEILDAEFPLDEAVADRLVPRFARDGGHGLLQLVGRNSAAYSAESRQENEAVRYTSLLQPMGVARHGR